MSRTPEENLHGQGSPQGSATKQIFPITLFLFPGEAMADRLVSCSKQYLSVPSGRVKDFCNSGCNKKRILNYFHSFLLNYFPERINERATKTSLRFVISNPKMPRAFNTGKELHFNILRDAGSLFLVIVLSLCQCLLDY